MASAHGVEVRDQCDEYLKKQTGVHVSAEHDLVHATSNMPCPLYAVPVGASPLYSAEEQTGDGNMQAPTASSRLVGIDGVAILLVEFRIPLIGIKPQLGYDI